VRAIDTNVVVRFLTNDDKRQAAAARVAIAEGDIFIAVTVLLEAEWVLRSAYGFEPARIARAFRGLAGLPKIVVEDPAKLAQALNWMGQGMDFADALHLAKAEGRTAFLSFDRTLAKVAQTSGATPVEEP
jgi:predicted nucleic-acid-binding protein